MLRPILAFLTLCLAAFLLAPTVASVHEKVTDLAIDRPTPWELFKWTDEPDPQIIPDCSRDRRQLFSEVTQYPARIEKDQAFMLRGVVQEADGGAGVSGIEVDLFLNETKEEPGILLGSAESRDGHFELITMVPFELKASRYHIVAHAHGRVIDCKRYLEHWSDPETDVVSNTTIRWTPVENAVAGRTMTVDGVLVDAVGAPVPNANLTVEYLGDKVTVLTDESGRFSIVHTPERAGNITFEASYKGSDYYRASAKEHVVTVASEHLELDGAGEPIVIVRSEPTRLSGRVYVADEKREDEVTLTFDGARVATCATCPANDTLRVPLATDGSFAVSLVVPPSESPGGGTLQVSGGGLEERYEYDVRIEVPTRLTLDAPSTGLFERSYEATVRLTDETGRPLSAPIAFLGPSGWNDSRADANGTATFSGTSGCGRYPAQASFNGTGGLRPSSVEGDVLVCGYLAFIPPWLVAVPWWVWPLAVAGALAAFYVARSLRQTYAPVIRSGPPLTLLFTQPADDAAGYAAVGEPVVVTAFLEQPLPDGHALRMGVSRATQERPLDADLRAHLRVEPDKLGDASVRAEIVDAKGRVVSRRTATLHVVRYGEEIERRYLELRARSGATDAVTPREFERWIHERAPGLDGDVSRRLVHLFEEADYSPRVAGRAEFAAYLAAERGVQEVRPDATVA